MSKINKQPAFKNRNNNILLETKDLYNAPGVMNAIFIFENIFKNRRGKIYKKLVNTEVGHAKENNMKKHYTRCMRTCFFSAECQNRLHGGKTGAKFILKDWSINYYKMPMQDHEYKPRFIYSIITKIMKDKTTKKYNVVQEYNNKTNRYNVVTDEKIDHKLINADFENTLEDYSE